MSFLLFFASLAFANPPIPSSRDGVGTFTDPSAQAEPSSDVAPGQAAFLLRQTAASTDFAGFTTYYADVACPTYLHAALGLTVEDAGYKTLYVIITVPSTRGGFSEVIMTDNDANGSIDTMNTIKASEMSLEVPLNAFTDVLGCYLSSADGEVKKTDVPPSTRQFGFANRNTHR